MDISRIIKEEFENTKIMTFFHGGNLDEVKSDYSHKKGRHEFGAGLYLTDDYRVVQKYSKGSRKLYYVEIYYGNEIDTIDLELNIVNEFIKKNIKKNIRDILMERINDRAKDGRINASIVNNLILNYEGLPSSKTNLLKNFLKENDIDYELNSNNFGFGDTTMVLYNTNKIKSIKRIQWTDIESMKIKNKY